MTHAGGDNREYLFESFRYSLYGEGDKVWVSVRENEERKVISFINLCGNKEDYWNEEKKEPETVNNLEVRILIDYKVKSLFLASPDKNMGLYEKLEYSIEKTERGMYLIVKIPKLYIWTVLSVEFDTEEILL